MGHSLELKKGKQIGDRTYKVYLDGYNQMDMITGKGPSNRDEIFLLPKLGKVPEDLRPLALLSSKSVRKYGRVYGWRAMHAVSLSHLD